MLLEELKTLREERGRLIADARQITDKAHAEKRELTKDETDRFDKLMADSDEKKKRVDKLEGDEARYKRAVDADEEVRKSAGRRTADDDRRRVPGRDAETTEARWKVGGGEERVIPFAGRKNSGSEYRAAYEKFLAAGKTAIGPDEARALSADNPTEGGFMVAPIEMVAGLIKAVDDQTFIRQFATVMQLNTAQSAGVPSLDADPADSDWTSEIQTGNEDSAMNFGRRELTPRPLAKRIKISQKLLRIATMGAEALVRARLAYKFGITQEKAFLTGTGANQPLGLFTASNDGIPTSRDVSTGNTSTAIGADGLIEAKYSLKAQYQASPTTRWLFHRQAVKQIRQLKDSTNQYLWQPGLTSGQPDRILDIPFLMSEYAPSTFTTGQYVGLLGDLKFYWIVEALQLSIQRLDELYALTNQVGFIGRAELDGQPVLAEAFARVKLA